MRVCLVAHGFPPLEKAGVETFTEQLARGLTRAGHDVSVFVPRRREDLPDLSLRLEQRDGYRVHWFTSNSEPRDPAEQLDPPGRAAQFAAFLERERPEVVHFHHVTKLGLGLVEQVHALGIPSVYTVHDYYPVCHRITLLRPDLSRCDTLGDPTRCAGCDLGLAVLNRAEGLGDYHMGAFAETLDEPVRERLAATLEGDRERSGFNAQEWEAAVELRTKLDARRSAVFGLLDRLVAPTRFLAERLVEGGVDGDRIVHLPYGIDTRGLGELPRADLAELTSRPIRVGYLGSMTKHKGVHVLLEAWSRLDTEAELHLWGDSTDRVHVERCRARADEVGAHWHGAFEQSTLPAVLAEVDLVVVPSIWVENYPIAIREALAAGRPVITSDVGALPESVRDSVDGRRFAPGDAADLARVLEECLSDPARIVALRDGADPIVGIDAQVEAYLEIYADAATSAAARREPMEEPLPHLRELAGRYAELQSLPSVELFREALAGLDRLAPILGASESSVGDAVGDALARWTRTQERLRDDATAAGYLREQIANHAESAEASNAESAWRAEQVENLEGAVEALRSERDWKQGSLTALEEQVASLESERDWRLENDRQSQERIQWLESEVANRDEALAYRESVIHDRDAALADREHQIADREHRIADLERRHGEELARLKAELQTLRGELERAEDQRRWREDEMLAAVQKLETLKGRLVPGRILLAEALERWRPSIDQRIGEEEAGP